MRNSQRGRKGSGNSFPSGFRNGERRKHLEKLHRNRYKLNCNLTRRLCRKIHEIHESCRSKGKFVEIRWQCGGVGRISIVFGLGMLCK